MAEIAGLALGGVAIAGLFTTCIELIDYLENSKDCARDMEISLTKLAFLRQRLRACGELISTCADEQAKAGLQCEIREHLLITTGLENIRSTLSAASALCNKHNRGADSRPTHVSPRPSHNPGMVSCSSPNRTLAADVALKKILLKPGQGRETGQSCNGTSEICIKPRLDLGCHETPLGLSCQRRYKEGDQLRQQTLLQRFRLKVIWAIIDRKKLDTFIANLDFLLSNLEKLAKALQMSAPNDKRKRAKKEAGKEQECGIKDEGEMEPEYAYTAPVQGETVMAGVLHDSFLIARGQVTENTLQQTPRSIRSRQTQDINGNTVTIDSAMLNSPTEGSTTPQPNIFNNSATDRSLMLNSPMRVEDKASVIKDFFKGNQRGAGHGNHGR